MESREWYSNLGALRIALYQTLTVSPYRERLDWQRHEWFFGDERTVPPDHPDSNWRMAYETLFRNAPIPMSQCHRMAGEAADTEAAAAASLLPDTPLDKG